uniref:F-box associated beta-propeller type 3 domain-containing protein n=1 Tax=Oryza punctata TaxID=4537 RepID=A0A0E0KUJ6_ORYPU
MAAVDAEEHETSPASSGPATRKRKRPGATATDGAPAESADNAGGTCDDVLRNIFSRLPTRAAVACTALSKHHRRLVTSAEFRRLHLPRPHVAYLATAPITRRGDDRVVSKFHGFHVAGAGMGIGHAPMRALTNGKYKNESYVNTCNGVILLAKKKKTPSGSFILWNPAIADDEMELTILEGLQNKSKTYKLLLCRLKSLSSKVPGGHRTFYHCAELVVYTLGAGAGEQARTVLSGLDTKIKRQSLYLDGTIYLLDAEDSIVFAFDVDDETVTTIDLPGERSRTKHANSKLMEMSGRVCVVTTDGPHTFSVWLLAAEDHRWQRRCAIGESSIYYRSITAVWDHGDAMLLLVDSSPYLYDITNERMMETKMPIDVKPEEAAYTLCWGYKPTLVSPGSIVGDGDEEDGRRCLDRTADILAAVKPVRERDVRRGRKATLDVTCFMEMLVRIMRKLPGGMQDVIDMPLLNVRYRCPDED